MSYSKPVDSNTNTNASSSVKNQVSQGPGPLSPPSSKKSSLRKLLNLKGLMKPMIVIMDEEAEERGEEDEVPKLSNLIIDIKMEDILLDLVLCNDANMNKIIKVLNFNFKYDNDNDDRYFYMLQRSICMFQAQS